MANWVAQGWAPKNTSYPASIALFTSGKAAMHINGVWEVPTMIDLAKQNKLGFEWGAVQIPVLFAHPATWADSHAFAIPARKGNDIAPDKLKAVLTTIAWINRHSISWAEAGHIPAYKPVTESQAFEKMKPNADYAALAKTASFDPKSTITGRRIAHLRRGHQLPAARRERTDEGSRRPWGRCATSCRTRCNRPRHPIEPAGTDRPVSLSGE